MPRPPEDSANVVDPHVLAARRAQRAAPVLEARLAAAEAERDELREVSLRIERELREARQREESERRVRVETEDEALAARRVTEEELREARRALTAAQERTRDLAREFARVERELAWRRAEADRAAARQSQLEEELGVAVDGARAERDLLQGELQRVRDALAEARAEQDRLTGALAAAETRRAAAEEALAQAQADRDAARAALDAAEAARVSRDARVTEDRDELERLAVAARESDAARAVLQAERDLLVARVEELVAERDALRAAPPEAGPATAPGDGELPVPRPFALVDPLAAAALREKLDGLAAIRADPLPAVARDLADAAARLREAAAPRPPGEPAGLGPPAAERQAAPAPAPAPAPGRTAARVATPGRPWLRDALIGLADDDPQAAARLLIALLPVQALRVRRPLRYDLRVEGADPVRVSLAPGRAAVEALPAGSRRADATISGTPAALAVLGGGGAEDDLAADVTGRRRRLRSRLLWGLRPPVTLAELARCGVQPEPGGLLGLLAGAARRADVDRPASVAVESGGRWRVELEPGRPVRVLAGGEGPVDATLAVAPDGLVAALAGLAPASGAKPRVTGSHAAVAQLLELAERVQR